MRPVSIEAFERIARQAGTYEEEIAYLASFARRVQALIDDLPEWSRLDPVTVPPRMAAFFQGIVVEMGHDGADWGIWMNFGEGPAGEEAGKWLQKFFRKEPHQTMN